MSPDLLQPLQIFSQLVVQTVGEDLNEDNTSEHQIKAHRIICFTVQTVCGMKGSSLASYLAVFAVLNVFLPVEEPVWDFVLTGILHDGHHPLNL